MISAVLFNLDETLLDRSEAIRAFISDQYRRHASHLRVIGEARYCHAFLELEQAGVVAKKLVYPALAARLGLSASLAAELFGDYAANYPAFATLRPDAHQTLDALRARGLKTGLISNGEADVQFGKLDALKLRSKFDVILVSGAEGLHKPDPKIFVRAAERLGLSLTECLFVGDNPLADVVGAEAAGMPAVWLETSMPWPPDVSAPRFAIKQLAEVLPLLGQF